MSTERQRIHQMMKKAIREAEKARGLCSPNPFVGAVIAKDDRIIASGHTQAYGSDHAEVQALKKAGKRAKGADLFVTLEPCSHHGKTPPCTDAIIQAGIKRVFFGIRDPNPLVNRDIDTPGPGIISMREAGIQVEWGFLKEQISRQLEYFLCRIQKDRPFVILKSALSMDGKYAAADGSSRWISNQSSRIYTHKLRQEVDAMLVGISTVVKDDPLLTVRLPRIKRQPLRAVLDAYLDIPLDSALIKSLDTAPLLVVHSHASDATIQSKAAVLKGLGVQLACVDAQNELLDLRQALGVLHELGYHSVMLESAGPLAAAFINQQLVDKLIIFYGAKLLGGLHSALADLDIATIDSALELQYTEVRDLSGDLMLSAYPRY